MRKGAGCSQGDILLSGSSGSKQEVKVSLCLLKNEGNTIVPTCCFVVCTFVAMMLSHSDGLWALHNLVGGSKKKRKSKLFLKYFSG